MSDIRSRTVRRNPCAWHVTLWRLIVGGGQRDGQPSADFISCVAFGRNGEFAEKHLKQGTKIVVTGRIQTGSYTNRDGQRVYTTDVVIEEQEFAESKKAAGEQGQNADYTDAGDGFMNIPDGVDEQLPFA